MQIKLELLEQNLQAKLLPVYLICGDEPFLIQEAGSLIRDAATQAGFTERKLFQNDDKEFQHLSSGMETMSLFADKTIYEFRLNKAPNAAAAELIAQWCNDYQSEDLLLITTPRMDKRAKNKAWVKAMSQLGAVIDVYPVNAKQFPGWLRTRASAMGMRLSNDAIAILSQRTEGNLLAANQELQRLNILSDTDHEIDADTLREFTADNAKFGQFDLIDSCLNGDSSRFVRMLHSLREEGTNIIEITAPLNAEIRKLCRIAWAKEAGDSLALVYKQFYVWQAKQTIYNKALSRYPVKVWHQLHNRLLLLDKSIKGQANRDAWLTLEAILLVIAGQRRFSKFISEPV